jgi:hypothetical protein
MKRLFLILITALFAIFIYSFLTEASPFKDQKEYLQTAGNLLNNNLLYSAEPAEVDDYRRFAKRPLGLPVYILLQHQNVHLIQISQAIVILLLFFTGLLFLRRFTFKRRSFILFGSFYALNLAFLIHSSFVFADLLLSGVTTIAVFLIYDTRNSLKNRLIWLSFMWALALAIKPVILPSLLLIPVLVVYYILKNKQFYWQLLLPFFVFVFTSSLNYKNTGRFEYSSMTTINLVQYNARLTIADAYGYDSAIAFSENKAFIIPRSKEEYATYKEEANEICKNAILYNINSYIKIHFLGSVKMVLDPGRFDLYNYFGLSTENDSVTEELLGSRYDQAINHLRDGGWVIMVFIALLGISLLKLAGFLFSIGTIRKTWPLFFVILYFMAVTGPVGAARLFLPVSVIFLIISILGLEKMLYFFQKRSKR